MRKSPRARQLAALSFAVLFLPAIPLPGAGAAPTPLASAQVDLNLWVHSDGTLSMAGNANDIVIPQGLTTHDWTMGDGLQKDLCIDGVDIGSGRVGFSVQLPVAWGTFRQDTGVNVTARVKDDTFVLANDTYPFHGTGTNSIWNINFTSGRTSCTVLKGHKLTLEFAFAATATASATTADYRNAHLAFKATDPVAPTVHTANGAGPTDAFYPNDIASNRNVIFAGALGNAFTDAFISAVKVQVRDPLGTPIYNGTATLTTGNFTHSWAYPPLASGTYTAWLEVDDTQSHTYNTSTTFRFLDYGLRISTQGQSGDAATRYTTQGTAALFALTVTNVGGRATVTALFIENTAAPGWTETFSTNSLSLEAGAADASTFSVTPAASKGPGNSTQATVIAQAQDDPSAFKARATLATTTIVQRDIALSIDPSRTDSTVKLGGTAFYNFTLTNNGGLATNITFNATDAPVGWARSLSGTGIVISGDTWRINSLGAGEPRALTLEVDAPFNTTGATSFECTLTARSEENASATATFVASTGLLLGIELTQTTPDPQPAVDPGGRVDIEIAITNSDPVNDHTVTAADINVTENSSNKQLFKGVGDGDITFLAPDDCCHHGEQRALTVTFQVPSHAVAGTYAFWVFANVDGNPLKVVQLELFIKVKERIAFSLHLDGNPSQVALPEGSANVSGTIFNDGNSKQRIYLTTAVLNAGKEDLSWSVRLLGADGLDLQSPITVDAFSQVRVALVITASTTAFNGEKRDLTATLDRVAPSSLSPPSPYATQLSPPVQLVVQLSSSTVLTRMWQQSSLFMLAFVLLALFSGYLGVRAIKGPRPPRPSAAAPPAAASAPAAAGAKAPPDRGAGPPPVK